MSIPSDLQVWQSYCAEQRGKVFLLGAASCFGRDASLGRIGCRGVLIRPRRLRCLDWRTGCIHGIGFALHLATQRVDDGLHRDTVATQLTLVPHLVRLRDLGELVRQFPVELFGPRDQVFVVLEQVEGRVQDLDLRGGALFQFPGPVLDLLDQQFTNGFLPFLRIVAVLESLHPVLADGRHLLADEQTRVCLQRLEVVLVLGAGGVERLLPQLVGDRRLEFGAQLPEPGKILVSGGRPFGGKICSWAGGCRLFSTSISSSSWYCRCLCC